MTVKSIRVHNNEDGEALYCYGDGTFQINSTNHMFQSAAHINSTDSGWGAGGTDIQNNGFSAAPPAVFEEDDQVAHLVNNGVFEAEWTGTGSSEQVNPPVDVVGLSQGDTVEMGAWVYITGAITSLRIGCQSYNGNTFLSSEFNTFNTVAADQWNYITTSGTIGAATATNGRMVIQANGNQSIGDKVYVGFAHINVNAADAVARPSTLMDKAFTWRSTLQQIGGTSNAGTIAQSLSGDWQINAAYSGGYCTLTYVNSVGGVNFNEATGVQLDVEREYEVEITHDYATGAFEMALYEEGKRNVVYSSTLTTTTGDPNYGSYGLDVMPDNWGIVTSMELYDHASVLVTGTAIETGTALFDGANHNGETITATQGNGQKNVVLLDTDMFEVSRNFTGAAGFTVTKSDRPELDFSGDMFVACAVQTANDAALDIVSSHSGTDGWRVSSVAGTAPAQQWQAVFSEGGSDITQTVATTINDGDYHYMGFQREAGVEYNLYSDDFETAAATVADTHTSLDGATSLDFLTEWQGAAGALVIFNRTLTDDERESLGDWMAQEAHAEAAPDFVDEAIVHFNPSSPEQKDAIKDRRILNLSHRPSDNLFVRYALTSTDGVAKPSLDSTHLEIPSVGITSEFTYEQGIMSEISVGPLDWQRGWLFEKGGTNNLRMNLSPTERELDQETITLMTAFMKTTNNVTGTDDDENIFEDATWRLYYANGTNSIIFEQDGLTQDTTVNALDVGDIYLISLEISAQNIDIRVNGTSISVFNHNFANVTPSGIEVGGSGNKRLHGVVFFASLFTRELAAEEEAAILSILDSTSEFSESIAVSESFDYVELNWG